MTDPHPPAAHHARVPDSADPAELGAFPHWSNIEADGYDDERAVAATYLAVLDQTRRLAGDLERGQLHFAYAEARLLHAAAADLVARLEQSHLRPGADGEPVWHDDGLDADRLRTLVTGHAQQCPVGRTLHPHTAAPDADPTDEGD